MDAKTQATTKTREVDTRDGNQWGHAQGALMVPQKRQTPDFSGVFHAFGPGEDSASLRHIYVCEQKAQAFLFTVEYCGGLPPFLPACPHQSIHAGSTQARAS